MNTNHVMRYVRIARELKELKERIDALKNESEVIERYLLSQMLEDGVSKHSVVVDDEGATVYIRKQVWAKRADGVRSEDVVREIERLDDAELRATLTTNAQSLSALLRETMEAGEQLPGRLAAMIEPDVRHKVVVTKGASRQASSSERALRGSSGR